MQKFLKPLYVTKVIREEKTNEMAYERFKERKASYAKEPEPPKGQTTSTSYFGTNIDEPTVASRIAMFLRRLADVIDARITVAYRMESFTDEVPLSTQFDLINKGIDVTRELFTLEVDVLWQERNLKSAAPGLY